MENILDWYYEGKPVTQLPDNCYGFVYRLKLAGDLFYIGKKDALSVITKPIKKDLSKRKGHVEFFNKNVLIDPSTGHIVTARSKRAKLRKLGVTATRRTYERMVNLSDWKKYESSSADMDNQVIIYKEILEFAPTQRSLTYLEEWWQFNKDVLSSDNYVNGNIGGRYFRNKLL